MPTARAQGITSYPNDARGGAANLIEPHRAPTIVYCASVSPNVRCVSANVRRTAASVSNNLRRKRPSIARLPHFDCAPLHLWAGVASRRRNGGVQSQSYTVLWQMRPNKRQCRVRIAQPRKVIDRRVASISAMLCSQSCRTSPLRW
jgi:hypothetical protein